MTRLTPGQTRTRVNTMKTLRSIFATTLLLFALAIQPVFLAGCGTTPTTRVNQVAGTVTITVDAAMDSWGEWVRAGKATVEDRIKVRSAYINYQNLTQIAEFAAVAALDNPDKQPAYVQALNAVIASHLELVKLIESFTKK